MKLNIKLALDRIAKDYADDRTFVKLPYELNIIKKNDGDWVKRLEEEIINDRYTPGPMQICDVPKGNHHIRPGAHLAIEDSVYYTALVGEAYELIHNNTLWARNRYDFSNALTGNADKSKWISDNFNDWRNFGGRSLDKIKQGYEFVLVADISGFYENINIQTLSYDLKQIGVANNVADSISRCLNHWAQNHGKGLPQGYSASHILAKLYLNSVDMRLRDDDFVHFRYVDDIRIFCKSLVEAKHALVVLSTLLRNRGLNLQTRKTKILSGKEARNYIEGVQPIIENILDDLKKEKYKVGKNVKEQQAGSPAEIIQVEVVATNDAAFAQFVQSLQLIVGDPYSQFITKKPATALEVIPQNPLYVQPIEPGMEFDEFEVVEADSSANEVENNDEVENNSEQEADLDNADPETVDISIIKRTFDSFFIKANGAHFDKTLFRFLLKRLSKANDKFALEYCQPIFEFHPEETETVLAYFKNVSAWQEAFEWIEEFLISANSIYCYQNYQLIEWLDSVGLVNPSDNIASLVRKWAFDNSKPYYLRSISRKYLSKFANASDLEMMERVCIDAKDPVEQAEVICAMQKMEKNRRNATYSRLGKHILSVSAIKYVKSTDRNIT